MIAHPHKEFGLSKSWRVIPVHLQKPDEIKNDILVFDQSGYSHIYRNILDRDVMGIISHERQKGNYCEVEVAGADYNQDL